MSEQLYKLGYKALTNNRMSIISGFYPSSPTYKYAKEYKVLERVCKQAYCGPLAVFNTLEDAKHFQRHNICVIYIVPCVYKTYTGNVQALWVPNYRFTHLPKGTVLASEVICLE